MEIKPVTDLSPYFGQLCTLLSATVAEGASIGFHHPLDPEIGAAYWHGVQKDTSAGTRLTLIAFEGGQVSGCVQLALAGKDNALHRAEVEKLMVHPSTRGKGLGRKLMLALEDAANHAGRTLIMLDTRTGDIAEGLYGRMGYELAGKIPGFTLEADGSFDGTSIFYKQLNT